MEFIIIEETDKDYIRQIIELEIQVFGESGAIDIWNLKPYIKYGRVYALVEDGEILACCEIIKEWNGEKAYLYGFAVKKEKNGKGIGKKFLEKILDDLKKENLKSIELTVSPENANAIKLYEKFGFEKRKFLENEYGKNIHRFLYKKTF